jgi:hypothetical protein
LNICRYAYLEKQLEAKETNGRADDGHKHEKRDKKDRKDRDRDRDRDRERKSSKREHGDRDRDRDRKRHHSSRDPHQSERDSKHRSRSHGGEKRCADSTETAHPMLSVSVVYFKPLVHSVGPPAQCL